MDPSHPKFLVRCESNPALYVGPARRHCSGRYSLTPVHTALPVLVPVLVPVPVCLCLWLPQLRYARCTILWMGEWTRNSMRAVPGMIVPNIMREDENANQTIDQLISIHESCKPRGATPRDYVQVRRVVACACVPVCLYGCAVCVPV